LKSLSLPLWAIKPCACTSTACAAVPTNSRAAVEPPRRRSVEKLPVGECRGLTARRALLIEKIPHRRSFNGESATAFSHAHAFVVVYESAIGNYGEQPGALGLLRC